MDTAPASPPAGPGVQALRNSRHKMDSAALYGAMVKIERDAYLAEEVCSRLGQVDEQQLATCRAAWRTASDRCSMSRCPDAFVQAVPMPQRRT